jgi:hypothetical protein
MSGLFGIVGFLILSAFGLAASERCCWGHPIPAVLAAPQCNMQESNALAEIMAKLDRVLEAQQHRSLGDGIYKPLTDETVALRDDKQLLAPAARRASRALSKQGSPAIG